MANMVITTKTLRLKCVFLAFMNAVCLISSRIGNHDFSLLSMPAKYANGNPQRI